MRSLALTVVFSVSMMALATVARAADIAPAPSAYDWSGFYIGLNAGAAWSSGDAESTFKNSAGGTVFSGALDNSIDGGDAVFAGGALAGYNFQYNALVLGVEADINYADFGGSDSNKYDFLGQDYESNLDWDANWFGTIRGRLGFAFDSLLLYGTGGLAYGGIDVEGNEILNGSALQSGSADETRWGWTAGVGAEYALNENWSIGAEYLYVDLGDVSFDSQSKSGTNLDAEVDYRFSVARATVKFGF